MIDRKIFYLTNLSLKFDYAKDIRLYNMRSWLYGLLKKFQRERFQWTKKISMRSLFETIVGAFLLMLRDGAAYFVLVRSLLNNEIGTGDFVFFFGIITGFSGWLNSIVHDTNNIINLGVRIGYYRDYFDIEDKFNHGSGYALPGRESLPAVIEFKNVSFKYPSSDKYIINNLNLKIEKGEKLAIVGVNGAGKTTLVKLLCGLYYPDEGEILLDGIPVQKYNIEDYYCLFSPVFQDIYLLPISIAEFISSTRGEKTDYKKVDEVLHKVGLYSKVSILPKGVHTKLMKGVFNDSIDLSGGEKQKLLLARALYKDAPYVILDEPTAALDPIAESLLYQEYNRLTKGKTSVYISHRLASTKFCDRIIFMENGEIVEEGTHDELMDLNGKYAHMFSLQSCYYKKEGIANG